jgi:hypothetical protein
MVGIKRNDVCEVLCPMQAIDTLSLMTNEKAWAGTIGY